MRIVFFETDTLEEEYFEKYLADHDLQFFPDNLTASSLDKLGPVDVLSTFMYSEVDREVLDALPELKLIATRSTGFDHVALDVCTSRGIVVSNVPSYGDNTVAEHTFALILTLARRLYEGCLNRIEGDFSARDLTGFDLKGKTIGVVGAGKIGTHVVRIARGFGMTVLVYDVKPQESLAEALGFQFAPLDRLLQESDIISLHVPYNDATHHLIDRQKFSMMRKGAYLINTARGGIVDQRALLEALDDGTLAGAGLDVLEGEEYIKEEKSVLTDTERTKALNAVGENALILQRKNVVYTPHIGFNTREAVERILETTVDSILGFASGEPKNVVNPDALENRGRK